MYMQEVDIHGMSADQAKRHLENIIKKAKSGTEITVIHGFHGGTALSDMVRRRLKNDKIKQKILSGNPGETIIIVK